MSIMESRRDFLKKSSIVLGGAAVLGMTGCAQAATEPVEPEIPAHPFTCCEFDLTTIEADAYAGFKEGGCCYGAAYALLKQLSEKVGYPFTVIPPAIFYNGGAGYTSGTLCGALGGAFAVIGMVCGAADARALTKELTAWYAAANLPFYQPEVKAEITTVAGSANCADSVTKFMAANGIAEMSDPKRTARCGGVTADVAKKAAELLNIHFGFMAAPVVGDETPELGANEYLGEADGFGGKVKVKVTMDGDKIAKIDVLSHGETAGVADPAFNTVPAAIIAANSTTVDVAAGATVTSNALIAAVNDALSKVGK